MWYAVAAGAAVLVIAGVAMNRAGKRRAAVAAAARDSATADSLRRLPVQVAPALVTAERPAPVAPKSAARAAPEGFSRCPRVTTPLALQSLVLLVDSIPQQHAGAELGVNYDVCGLPRNTPYTTEFTVRRKSQSRFRRIVGGNVKPVAVHLPDIASGPRSRKHHALSLAGLPPGDYTLDIAITDARARTQTASREFSIAEK
jgi:hypothetical protein